MPMSTINIHLNTSRYVAPTEQDIKAAKAYILKRSDVANELADLIGDLLTDAAVKIVQIAYKYNFPGDVFTIGASPEQQQEINAVMDELEQRIYEMLEDKIFAQMPQEDSNGAVIPMSAERKAALLAFMLALGHKNQNLRSTLYNYQWRFLYDLEAAIAALKLANVNLSKAITKIRSHIGSIYTMSEVQAAIRRPNNVMAAFLRSAGVPHNPDGSPNLQGVPREGYNAIINSIRITNDIVWGHNQLLNFIDRNAAGFYVLRGSTYPCRACDDNTGFHPMTEQEAMPPIHPHCCCYTIPIFTKL
jgi:hypothetical protein